MKREIIGKRLKDIREKLELTRKEVSKTVDIGTTTLQQWENGTREASIETIEKLAKLYNTTAQYIIFGDTTNQAPTPTEPTIDDEYVYIPFYDIQASAELGLFTDGATKASKHLAFRKRWVQAKGLQADKLVALHTKGDSMETTLKDGAIIIIDTTKTTPADGGLYVVRIEDALYIKRVQPTPQGLRLISDNTRYDPLDINYKDYSNNQLQICGQLIHTSYDL